VIGDYSGPWNGWPRSVWIGYEPRECDAFIVARSSLVERSSTAIDVHSIILADMERAELYRRPYYRGHGNFLKDKISDAPMSTEFAISRFLTPHLARDRYPAHGGWALYMDCDMLVRADVADLFALADPAKAVMCVKHRHEPRERTKMDGQEQIHYARKNWSSVMLFNCEHPANASLTVDLINRVPGRDLHRFCWLEDDLIGELPAEWNHLVGYSGAEGGEPKIVHFTNGTPSMLGMRMPYADEWREQLHRWVRGPSEHAR